MSKCKKREHLSKTAIRSSRRFKTQVRSRGKEGGHLTVNSSCQEDRDTTTGRKYRKFREIWTCDFQICEWQTYKETDRHTDTLIAILRTPTAHKIKIGWIEWYCPISRSESSKSVCSWDSAREPAGRAYDALHAT